MSLLLIYVVGVDYEMWCGIASDGLLTSWVSESFTSEKASVKRGARAFGLTWRLERVSDKASDFLTINT